MAVAAWVSVAVAIGVSFGVEVSVAAGVGVSDGLEVGVAVAVGAEVSVTVAVAVAVSFFACASRALRAERTRMQTRRCEALIGLGARLFGVIA